MKVIEVIRKGNSQSQARIDALAQQGFYFSQMQASWLSPITAMRIAKEIERQEACAVVVHTVTDAMAAISARKLVNNTIQVVVSVLPNSKVSNNITDEIIAGVDKWIFPSQRLMQKYPPTLKNTSIRTPWDYDMSLPDASEREPEEGRMLWMGSVDANIPRLMRAIDKVGKDGGASILIVVGTGKAQHVMRAVRKARAISCPQCVVWKGEEYDLEEELKLASSIVQSQDDATGSEMRASSQLAIPLIEI